MAGTHVSHVENVGEGYIAGDELEYDDDVDDDDIEELEEVIERAHAIMARLRRTSSQEGSGSGTGASQ